MNTLITDENLLSNYTNGLEKRSSTCRNYPHHSTKGDYVRHQPYTQTLVRPYAVTIKTIRLPTEFFGVVGFSFSDTEVLL